MADAANTAIQSDTWQLAQGARSLTYFATRQGVSVSRAMLDELKRLSIAHGTRGNARFCLHASPEEALQDMVILEYRDTKCRKPHMHSNSNEAIHVIEGRILALIFDSNGNLLDKRVLEPEGEFAYRNPKGRYHLYFPLDDHAVYREIRDGTFERDKLQEPLWDHARVLKPYLSDKDMACFNRGCQSRCSLSKL